MLIGIICGINVIDTSYIFNISEKGFLIMSDFKFDTFDDKIVNPLSSYDLNILDLTKDNFKSDSSVLNANCDCFSCKTGYTKAYLNHLFKCNELNGPIILLLHNLKFIENLIFEFNKIEDDLKLKAFYGYINKLFASQQSKDQ